MSAGVFPLVQSSVRVASDKHFFYCGIKGTGRVFEGCSRKAMGGTLQKGGPSGGRGACTPRAPGCGRGAPLILPLVLLFLLLAVGAVFFGAKGTAGFSREIAGILVVVLAVLALIAWRVP